MWRVCSRRTRTLAVGLAILGLFPAETRAQDMEPRRWSHLPTGLNIAGAGLVATEGDIFFDPVMKIEDGTFELYTLATSYIRTFEWLGKSSRVDFNVPYAYGRWEGLVDGVYRSTRRHGFNDPRIRLSMNLYGAPPLTGKALMDYRMKHPVSTTIGAAVSVTLPLGEYYADRLINLGRNRYVIRPQIGALHQRGPWQFELTTSVSLYSDNDEYLFDTVLEQDPLWFLQGHVIRSFSRGMWASLSGGFTWGGESQVDGVDLENDDRTKYFALSFGMPISRQQSMKLTYVNADTNVVIGSSSDSLILSWSMNWGGG
jgi:hypothetical protein